MRRSLFLLMAAILAFLRVFVLGIAAVFVGMTDYGGISSALLRIFQVYSLFFVYIVILQYLKPAAREFLRMPSLVVASASCVLSAFAYSRLRRRRSLYPDRCCEGRGLCVRAVFAGLFGDGASGLGWAEAQATPRGKIDT